MQNSKKKNTIRSKNFTQKINCYKNCIEFNQNLALIVKITLIMNKIFLVFEKFNKIPLLGLYFSREKLATYFFFKIKSEIKSIINFLFKKNQIISTIYKILTYYQFSTLNSEIKIGKTKKFIFEFLKLKKKKNFNFGTESHGIYQTRPPVFKNFVEKKLSLISSRELNNKNWDIFERIKSKLFFYFKIKVNRIFLIKKKTIHLRKIVNDIFNKATFKEIEKKKSDKFFFKKNILFGESSRSHDAIPIGVKKNSLLYNNKASKILIFIVLFRSRIFKNRYKEIIHLYNIFKKRNDINLQDSDFKSFFSKHKTKYEFKKPLKSKWVSTEKTIEKFYTEEKFSKKYRYRIFGKLIFYRLFDINNESFFLWKKNNLKSKSNSKTKITTKGKNLDGSQFLKNFFYENTGMKIFISSIRHKIQFFKFKIDSGVEEKIILSKKLKEFKGMDVDFQVFINLVKKLNIIEKK